MRGKEGEGICRTNNLINKNNYVHIISTFVNVKQKQVENIDTGQLILRKLVNLIPPDVRF